MLVEHDFGLFCMFQHAIFLAIISWNRSKSLAPTEQSQGKIYPSWLDSETGILNISDAVSRKYKFEEAVQAFHDLDQGSIVGRAVIEIS